MDQSVNVEGITSVMEDLEDILAAALSGLPPFLPSLVPGFSSAGAAVSQFIRHSLSISL